MSAYATEHATALEQVQDAGVAITLERSTRTYDAAADTSTHSRAAITGYAVAVPGDPVHYQGLGLTQSSAVTLLFVADLYDDDEPGVGYTGLWDGVKHTVRDVVPVAPDGTPILYRLVVTR